MEVFAVILRGGLRKAHPGRCATTQHSDTHPRLANTGCANKDCSQLRCRCSPDTTGTLARWQGFLRGWVCGFCGSRNRTLLRRGEKITEGATDINSTNPQRDNGRISDLQKQYPSFAVDRLDGVLSRPLKAHLTVCVSMVISCLTASRYS